MDVVMTVERLKLLAEQRHFGAIKVLCDSPEVKTLVKTALLIGWGLTDGVVQLLEAHEVRDYRDVAISETEIDSRTAQTFVTAGIVTLGDLQRTPDDVLLRLPECGDAVKVWGIRAVQKKYLESGDGARKNAKRRRA